MVTLDILKNMSESIQQKNINRLLNGEKLPWGEIAEALEYAHENELWAGPSFSSWVRGLANKLEVQASLLWRYRSARAFYIERTKKGNAKIPDFEEISPRINALNLDILKRIASVAPEEETQELLEKLVNGKISRLKLNKIWTIYRDALDGETLRGHSTIRNSKGKKPRSSQDEQHKAKILEILFSQPPTWMNLGSFEKFRFFPRTEVPSYPSKMAKVDSLLVTNSQERIEFHGIDFHVAGSDIFSSHPMAKSHREYPIVLDSYWLLTEAPSQINMEILDSIGVISIEGETITLVKKASTLPFQDDLRLQLAKKTLARIL